MTQEELVTWSQAPGLSDLERTQKVHDFLVEFKEMLEIYKSAFGEPLGLSVDSKMDQAEWYMRWFISR